MTAGGFWLREETGRGPQNVDILRYAGVCVARDYHEQGAICSRSEDVRHIDARAGS